MFQSKAVAGTAALEVLNTAMRVGGGAASRKDIEIERYFCDARRAQRDAANRLDEWLDISLVSCR